MITIYTDGSCKGNPGPGGWAAIILKNEKDAKPWEILKGNEKYTTNNRMEMMAIIKALHFIHDNKLGREKIILHTDSNLLVQTINKGWKKKANQDLWQKLDELNEKVSVEFKWVKGHHTNHWNNECDKHAQSESTRAAKKS